MELLISGPHGPPSIVDLRKTALSLGRSVENDLAYPEDPWLSRAHLCFERHRQDWFVRDCSSRNGTIVNSATLTQPHKLNPGDRIYAGHLTIEIRDQNAAQSPRPIQIVPDDTTPSAFETTFVTSLDKVLGQTARLDPGKLDLGKLQAAKQDLKDKQSTLNTGRVVRALIRAGQELAGHRPLHEVFAVILDLALSAVDAKRGVILALEDGGLQIRASRGDGFTISKSVCERVVSEKCSLMVSDAQMDSAFREQKSIVMQRVRSLLAVPLQTRDQVLGLIYVDNGAIVHPFVQEDLDLLTVMANVAAIRIEHARLALIEEAEKRTALDLQQASEIQLGLLPTEVPKCDGYDLAGFNLPCRTVGGDYYDFLPYADGRLGLVVGDVSGKGLPAALLMSSLEARVQMLAETGPDPATAVTALNRNFAAKCPIGKFITFFYGLLDVPTGRLLYANAGHNYPLIIRHDGSVESLTGHGMVMGIFPHSEYELNKSNLNPGDMLALFSDGVTEAGDCNGEEFGDSGLAKFLIERRFNPCEETVNALVAEVRQWCGVATFADDFTIVLLRRNAA